MQSMERYASRVANMKTGPAGRERMVDGLCALGDNAVSDCLKDVGALTPAMENFYAAGLARVEKAAAPMVSFEKAADANLAYAKAHEGERMMLEGSGGWMVDGSSGKVARKCNQLVSSSNRLSR